MDCQKKRMREAKILLILALIFAGCRTPQKLMEKAIERDPTVISIYSDTVTLTRLQIDSVLVEIGDTLIWEKIITETKYDTIIPVRMIELERAKTRQEVRKSHRLDMALIKSDERSQRLQNKLDQLQAKLEAKTDRVKVRHETKIVRARSRWWLWLLIGIASTLVVRIILKKGPVFFRKNWTQL